MFFIVLGFFSVSLLFKLRVALIVMSMRQMAIKKLTGASLGFGKTILSASYNMFLTSVSTSVCDPQAPALVGIEEKKINPNLEVELNAIRSDEGSKRKDENLYPIMNLTAFISLPLPLSPV